MQQRITWMRSFSDWVGRVQRPAVCFQHIHWFLSANICLCSALHIQWGFYEKTRSMHGAVRSGARRGFLVPASDRTWPDEGLLICEPGIVYGGGQETRGIPLRGKTRTYATKEFQDPIAVLSVDGHLSRYPQGRGHADESRLTSQREIRQRLLVIPAQHAMSSSV